MAVLPSSPHRNFVATYIGPTTGADECPGTAFVLNEHVVYFVPSDLAMGDGWRCGVAEVILGPYLEE
jgi:hypothetical protein